MNAGFFSEIINFMSKTYLIFKFCKDNLLLLDSHDLLLQVEPVRRPLEAGDLLVLPLHHARHLLQLPPEVRDGLLQVGSPGEGSQRAGVGLHVIGAEEEDPGDVPEAVRHSRTEIVPPPW